MLSWAAGGVAPADGAVSRVETSSASRCDVGGGDCAYDYGCDDPSDDGDGPLLRTAVGLGVLDRLFALFEDVPGQEWWGGTIVELRWDGSYDVIFDDGEPQDMDGRYCFANIDPDVYAAMRQKVPNARAKAVLRRHGLQACRGAGCAGAYAPYQLLRYNFIGIPTLSTYYNCTGYIRYTQYNI